MNQSGFLVGDFAVNHLLNLVNGIHKSFNHRTVYEVRTVFYDITNASFK